MFHLALGLISVFIVVKWSGDLIFSHQRPSLLIWVTQVFHFSRYLIWLIWQIIVANILVLRIALSPRLLDLLNPQLKTFTFSSEDDVPRFVLANSITLTPGTVTADVDGKKFLVYAINDAAADGVPGEMADKVVSIFKKNL